MLQQMQQQEKLGSVHRKYIRKSRWCLRNNFPCSELWMSYVIHTVKTEQMQ